MKYHTYIHTYIYRSDIFYMYTWWIFISCHLCNKHKEQLKLVFFFSFLQSPLALFPMIKYLPYPKVNKFPFFHSAIPLKKNELFPSVMYQYVDVFQTENMRRITGLVWFCKGKEIISIIGSTSGRPWAYTDSRFGKIIMASHQQNVMIMKENRSPNSKQNGSF